jgi:NADH dehydrogenase
MILVTGGAGVMGSRLVRGLVEKGEKVRVLTLPNDPFVESRLKDLGDAVEVRYGDVSNAETLEGVFDGVKTTYHLAAILINKNPEMFEKINVNGTRNILEGSIAAGAEHFVFVSSASVVYPFTTPYSLSKRQCEEMVQAQDAMKWTIVRPTLAYNEFGGEEFMMFQDYLLKYPVVPFIGSGRALKRPVHVDDLMHGFLAIPGNEKSYGKIYAFSGGEAIPIWDLAKLMLRHQGVRKPFLPLPIILCQGIEQIMRRTMEKPPLTWNAIAGVMQDANLDNSQAREDLGYNPIGVREGLQKCFPI